MAVIGQTFSEGRRRLSVAHLLAAIVALFVVEPLVANLPFGPLVEEVVFTLVLLAGVNAVGGHRRTLIIAALLAVPTIAFRWVEHLLPGLLPHNLNLALAIVFIGFVMWRLFRFVIAAPRVTAEVLCAAISVYLLLAVAWAFVYTLMAQWDPSAFLFVEPSDAGAKLSGFLALYFSIQIITTASFGDILPLSSIARMTTLLETSVGVFYMAILISRLVGLYSSGSTPQDGSSPE